MNALEVMRTLSPVAWLNILLSAIGVLVAFGAINRMNQQTEWTIAIAFTTIASGLAGYVFGTFLPPHWQSVFDTLILGGVVALMIGSRKRTTWVRPELMPKISASVSAVTWAAFFFWIA